MTKKRKVKDIPIEIGNPDFIKNLANEIKQIQWPYTSDLKDKLQDRDQALAALLSLIGPRISEALKLQRKWFTVEPDQINVASIQPEKHGDTRENLWLPRNGPRAPLTEIFYDWLVQVPDDPEAYVFPSATAFGICINWKHPIERTRAHWIIKTTVGKMPHWYRGVTETYCGRKIFKSDPYKLKNFMGVKRMESLFPYVAAPWEQDMEAYDRGES